MQISESHCGPAVIQMLLSRLGVEASQEQIAEAGGAARLIAQNGMRVDQLAQAVHRIAPHLNFYYKDHSTIRELAHVVNDYRQPAGVEWQGVFEDDEDDDDDDDEDEDDEDEDEEDEDTATQNPEGQNPEGQNPEVERPEDSESDESDYGHYSLVTRADRRRHQLIISDPYKDYFSQARVFSFEQFDQRWYDYNEVSDPITSRTVIVKDDHLFFVVVPHNVTFPRRIGMKSFPR